MKPKTAGRVGGGYRPAGHMAQATSPFAGLVAGASIPTLNGNCAVEDLCPGTHVITRNAGAIPIERIETRSVVTQAVYVIAGSLGHDRPDRDSLLSGAQRVLVRDWRAKAFLGQTQALVPAQALIDGEFIEDVGQRALTLFRIFCGAPRILYADGMELASADDIALSRTQDAA
ncbi:Hint domain-containing protein [Roseobacter sp. YSTF-M11]|uniref:Hint domain-containing protein n=1 Tax=Roseobacter insulae TaxID=2859783 RepID=A0A9X1JYQ0_9RHOB|nr:Hint domain-containing protein [Roseobacter insulae]MBW4708511.1 Hint domain-containing protein [Roseobacter insulae]